MGRKILISLAVVVYLFVFYVVLDANKYKAMVHIIEGAGRVGVNPTSESLDFGDISLGMSATRKVDITNQTVMPVRVLVWTTGDIEDLMNVSDKNFRVGAHSDAEIEFSTYIPASAAVDRDYEGRVYIFKIPTFGL